MDPAVDAPGYRGRELYHATEPQDSGFRRHVERLGAGSMDELRAVAQSFTAQSKAIYVAALQERMVLM